tara:strand:+ start:644 stop:1282 length:639 start_codon:yes stop_codon:yes gene_type:complete
LNSNSTLRVLKARFEQDHEVRKRSLALHRTLSGQKLAEEIAETNPTLVLDLGCGSNEFKKIVPNVIGVDVAELPEVDFKMSIQNFHRRKPFKERTADWILCFGPFNYGGTKWATEIGECMRYYLAEQGTVVCHTHPTNSEIDWTEENITNYGKEFGFETVSVEIGYTDIMTMSMEELDIQQEVASRSPDIAMELSMGKDQIRPMVVWRWKHK